jgi:hypothetical protein
MTTANRFSPLFKSSDAKSVENSFPSLEEAMQVPDKFKQEPTASSSQKKMPIKMIIGHRSYEEDLRSQDMEQERKRTEAYVLLANKQQLGEKLNKTRMCNSVDKDEPCAHGESCRFAHSLSELKISECLFGDNCRFIRVWNHKIINNGEKICNHKHPQETVDSFFSRVGLDRYNNRSQQPVVHIAPPLPPQPVVHIAPPLPQQPVVHIAPPLPQQPVVHIAPPLPQQPVVHIAPPLPPQPVVHIAQQTVDDTTRRQPVNTKSPDQVLIIRVPKELAAQALEIAMRSGKSSIQIEII